MKVGWILVALAAACGTDAGATGHRPRCRDADRCEALCSKQGDAQACVSLGWMAAAGQRVSRDPARAAALFAQACWAVEPAGCRNYAYMVRGGRGVARDRDLADDLERVAVAMHRNRCERGNAEDCSALGALYLDGVIVSKDEKKAMKLLRKACDAGEPWACARVAWKLGEEGGDSARAEKLILKAAKLQKQRCRGGEPDACMALAGLLRFGKGRFNDPKRAAELFEEACDDGEGYACSMAAGMYEWGDGVTKDEAKAARLFERGCKLDDSWSCTSFAQQLRDGRGVDRDPARAVKLYQEACDEDESAFACEDLGDLFTLGTAVPTDAEQAKRWYGRAMTLYERECDADERYMCERLAEMYAVGKGVLIDQVKAERFRQRARDLDARHGGAPPR